MLGEGDIASKEGGPGIIRGRKIKDKKLFQPKLQTLVNGPVENQLYVRSGRVNTKQHCCALLKQQCNNDCNGNIIKDAAVCDECCTAVPLPIHSVRARTGGGEGLQPRQ